MTDYELKISDENTNDLIVMYEDIYGEHKATTSIDKIIIGKEIMNNGLYKKSNVDILLKGNIITKIPDAKYEKTKQEKKRKRKSKINLIQDKYSNYKSLIKRTPITETTQWAYNIIDGLKEQESILYRDEKNRFVVIPDINWKHNTESIDYTKLHILVIFSDKSLYSIRDLTAEHIEVLKEAKKVTYNIINMMYDIPKSNILSYFHYKPSTWLLHIHFVTTLNKTSFPTLERNHLLDYVIQNLEIDSNYYKKLVIMRSS